MIQAKPFETLGYESGENVLVGKTIAISLPKPANWGRTAE